MKTIEEIDGNGRVFLLRGYAVGEIRKEERQRIGLCLKEKVWFP